MPSVQSVSTSVTEEENKFDDAPNATQTYQTNLATLSFVVIASSVGIDTGKDTTPSA